jgi:transposase
MRFGAGSFSSDAKGRWYINVPIEVACSEAHFENAIGVDLGLKTTVLWSKLTKYDVCIIVYDVLCRHA